MVIVVGGMIGLGKTSVAKVLGEHFKSEVYYESVEDNPILPLFYKESEEECQKKRYPFLLQLHFLNSRYESIKQALTSDKNILDRSIYEDWYFAKKNMELGRISELEMSIYENLLNNMMQELKELPKKSPDLMIYLKGSFETVLNRINQRGREYEVDESLKDYYEFLWKDYDDWVENCYKASNVLIVDMDKMDVVHNPKDKIRLIEMVEDSLINKTNINHAIDDLRNKFKDTEFNYSIDNENIRILYDNPSIKQELEEVGLEILLMDLELRDFVNIEFIPVKTKVVSIG